MRFQKVLTPTAGSLSEIMSTAINLGEEDLPMPSQPVSLGSVEGWQQQTRKRLRRGRRKNPRRPVSQGCVPAPPTKDRVGGKFSSLVYALPLLWSHVLTYNLNVDIELHLCWVSGRLDCKLISVQFGRATTMFSSIS